MKKCVFAGTFDPFTVGHEDTVKKCLALFDEVVVAVAENKQKRCYFTTQEREEMIGAVFAGTERVRVLHWEGAVVDLLRAENTPFYVRGLRNEADFAYETADFYASRDLDSSFIELYLPAEQRLRKAHFRLCSAGGVRLYPKERKNPCLNDRSRSLPRRRSARARPCLPILQR